MEKNFEVSSLLDFYGEFLTANQREVLYLYYNEDLSLSEIADNQGITRQGVRDTIKKAETKLFDMEKKLELFNKFNNIQPALSSIIENSKKIELISKKDNRDIYKLANTIKNTAINIYEQ